MIRVNQLSVRYGGKKSIGYALDRIDLEVSVGDTLAVMGQSGSGKSTLLAVLGGMLRPVSGVYEFNGVSIPELTGKELLEFRGREIGFVFQNFCLLPHLTILENLLVPVEHLTQNKSSVIARAHTLLEQVDIAGLASRFPAQISGGQAQRVAIARAMMRSPQLILADEPTGSLDEESAKHILALLNSLSINGTTVIVVTHSAQVAQRLRRVVRLESGHTFSQKLII